MKNILAVILSAVLAIPVSLLAQQAPAPAQKPIVVSQADTGATTATGAALGGVGVAVAVGILVVFAIALNSHHNPSAPTATK